MPKVWQIEKALDDFAPKKTALSYDNVGLLVGDAQADVKHVLLALDITPDVVVEAKMRNAQMIVSHHPVIFNPYKTVTKESYDKSAVMRLIRDDIAAVCMHTNLDIAENGVNDALAETLELSDIEKAEGDADGILRIGTLPYLMEMSEFAAYVRQKLNCPGVWYSDAKSYIERVAVCGGAGGGTDELALAVSSGADAYVTSEIHHHAALQAEYLGIGLVDAGHFYTERPVLFMLDEYLRKIFPDLDISISPLRPSGYYSVNLNNV